MNTEVPVEQLLRWRLARAEAEAPRAPGGARLLELVRPWWEICPERFQSMLERVGRIRIAYGHAMTQSSRSRGGHPVPALIVRAGDEIETSVCVLYFAVRDGRLRLRFQLDTAPAQVEDTFEVTFVSESSSRPLFCASGMLSVDSEYRVDAELSEQVAGEWISLKVTDRMPFRLILRAPAGG